MLRKRLLMGGREARVQGLLLAAALPAAVAWGQGWGGERVRRETERVSVEWRADELSADEAESFAALADNGVAHLESLVAAGLPPWARRAGRVRFVISSRVGMSRTYGRTVLLPLDRVRSRSAPYLHETAHALIPARGDCVWLSEGLASYLESWVSENLGGYDAHIFTRAGDHGIHTAARRYLASDLGRAVLPWVGGQGEPPRLEEDRSGVARPFYVLSQSLTKYVVEGAHLEAVVRALTSTEADALLGATGRSSEQWRREWLAAVQGTAGGRTGSGS